MHIINLRGRSEFGGFNPSDAVLVVAGIARRNETVAIIAAAVHQRPRAHAIIAAIAGVVHIGQTQTVRELMADSTDAIHGKILHTRPIVLLGGALIGNSIGIDPEAFDDFKIQIHILQFPFMRPDSTFRTTIGFALAGIDDHHLIHFTIAVPVVLAPVRHLILSQLNSLDNHLLSARVLTICIVLTIVLGIFADGDRAYDVEGQFK